MTPPRRTLRVAALLLLTTAWIAGPWPAAAQSLSASPGPVAVPLQDLPAAESLGDRLERIWSGVIDSIGFGTGSMGYAIRQNQTNQTDDFTWLMDIAGFKLKEIESTVGLIPGLTLVFGQSRELSEADREFLLRSLDRHARRHGGPIAVIQRAIVSGILDANEIGGFGVDKLQVTLMPLPYVKFTLSPVDPPLGQEASRILRSIDRLNQRLQTMSPSNQGFEQRAPGPAQIRPAVYEIQH
ncbi:hypothetical protein C8P66_10762 [Humitalea rosea]|uniref:Uncharacterized protein n=1 Tax=Humitalea rosea TaxID=990373 RepID=A0A2W7IJ93_9PROT|nr:hypothetical protein C8P66_10762 [Humitalea rosea]